MNTLRKTIPTMLIVLAVINLAVWGYLAKVMI